MTQYLRHYLIFASIVLLLTIPYPLTRIAAQDGNLWVFQVIESSDHYSLVRVNVDSGNSEIILSLSKTTSVSLASIIPSSETEAVRSMFQEQAEAYFNIDADQFLGHSPVVTVESFAPAPDNQNVAMNVTYQACTRGLYDVACFGTSQIILVSVPTGQQQVLWELGLHSKEYFPGNLHFVKDVYVSDLLWLPDQQALIVALSNDSIRHYQGNLSLVIIPLLPETPPFQVGSGITWTVAPNSREIMAISRYNSGLVDTLHRIDFDLSTREFTTTDFSLEPYVISPEFGQVYLNSTTVFNITYDKNLYYDSTYLPSLGMFTPDQPTPLAIFRPNIGGYEQIRAATTGDVAVIQNTAGLLWKAIVSDGILQVEPLTEYPVTFWQFVDNDILVLQPEGSTQYQAIDLGSNIPPTANAGPDQTLQAESNNVAQVTLDGSNSVDVDGTITAYYWYENGTLIAEGVTPQVELAVGVHTIALTVEDDDAATDSDDVIITVEPASGCTITAPADPPTYTVAAGDVTGLIAAIDASNANSDPDIIALEEGTNTLTAADNTGYGKNGLPIITTPITFYGNCAIIERDPTAEAFRFFQVASGGNLTLYDLTLTGGDGGSTNGGAIYSQGSVTATNITIANSTAAGGAGIRNSGGTLTLISSQIEGNTTTGSGGGVYNSGTTTFTDTTLTGNDGHYGGALYNASGGTLTLNNTIVETNTAYNGSGMFINGGDVTVQSASRFTANSATNHGGAIYNNGGGLTIAASTFELNTATSTGGGLRNSGALNITNSTFSGNTAQNNGGGVFHLSGTAILTGVTLTGNHSGVNGGGLFTLPSVTMGSCMVNGNTADNDGGGLFIAGNTLTITGSQIINNTAADIGGGVFSSGGSVSISASTLDGNVAANDGGGIATDGPLTITDSLIQNNQAGDWGGGVYNDDVNSTGIDNSCISGNSALEGGGVFSITANFDAADNWWGATDGPSGSGTGSGDAVNANVLFAPSLTAGCPH